MSTLPSSSSSSQLSSEVRNTLSKTLPSSDPLDNPKFDPVDYINNYFPQDNVNIDDVAPFLLKINQNIEELDQDMSKAIKEQSQAGEKATKEIQQAQSAIKELSIKISDITDKAEESEAMVHEICKDIKQLDYAKRHLLTTITALKRLHMLVTAVDQLDLMTREHEYRDAANLLDAVRQLYSHFESYSNVPKIQEISKTIEALEEQLNSQVQEAFEEIHNYVKNAHDPGSIEREVNTSKDQNENAEDLNMNSNTRGIGSEKAAFKNLSEACLVVDALGIKARKKYVDKFCEYHLEPYEQIFSPTGEYSGLESIERRFAWFRRLLKMIDQRFIQGKVFPDSWCIDYCLTQMFLEKTHIAILTKLSEGIATQDNNESEQVQVLLKALQKSLLFEKEMLVRFDPDADVMTTDELRKKMAQGGGQLEASGLNIHNPYNNSENASKFSQLAKDGVSVASKHDKDKGHSVSLPIIGMISSVFDKFMGPYIEMEDKNMREMRKKAVSEDEVDRNISGSKLPVFSSSVNMFVYIKNAIKRCTALTTSATFFTLTKKFQGCLEEYAEDLKNKMPPSFGQLKVGNNDFRTSIGTTINDTNPYGRDFVRLKDGEEVNVCYVINTAEYCAEIVPQLEEMMKNKIDITYTESIDLTSQQNKFYEVVDLALNKLIGAVGYKCDIGYKSMFETNWAAEWLVEEELPYVGTITNAVKQMIPPVRDLLSDTYYPRFCDKLAGAIIPTYYNMICRCRRINEDGAQQLRVDVYNIRKLMEDMPQIGQPNTSGSNKSPPHSSHSSSSDGSVKDNTSMNGKRIKISPIYKKYVEKNMTKIETLLKLVSNNNLAENFKTIAPDGTSADLIQVMNLKGMNRQQQQNILSLIGFDRSSFTTGNTNMVSSQDPKRGNQRRTSLKSAPGGGNYPTNRRGSNPSDPMGNIASNMANYASGVNYNNVASTVTDLFNKMSENNK